MYLKELHIKYFRSIKELKIQFNKGLNVIIGENNSGKSAIIDALRICLGIGHQNNEIYVKNDDDFHIDVSTLDGVLNPIEFHLRFEIETPADREVFTKLQWQNPKDDTDDELHLSLKYSLELNSKDQLVMFRRQWGGNQEGNTLDYNELQNIFFTYLAPLRNAEQELKPYASNNKVTSLFKVMTKYLKGTNGSTSEKRLDDDHKIELAKKLQDVVNDDEWSGLIKTGEKFVNEHLEKADISNKQSKVNIGLLEYRYENIIKGVLTRKEVYPDSVINGEIEKQKYFSVSQNGLGENNLILASAVLGDIENRRNEGKEHYYAMLIEEPEAHLHPHKQNTFFNHLNQLQGLDVQLFITSHSPTITAKTSLDSLHVLQNQNNEISIFSPKYSKLTIKAKKYLSKFLDVTKAQLFFANGVILVEGISEALLIPIIAEKMDESGKYNLDKNGIEIVNVGGVGFNAFAVLFNSNDEVKRLSSRCSLVSDDDKGLISSNDFYSKTHQNDRDKAKKIVKSLRAKDIIDNTNRVVHGFNIETLILDEFENELEFIKEQLKFKVNNPASRALKALKYSKNNLKTYLANITFEYELMLSGNNIDLIQNLYKKMHPQTNFLDDTKPVELRARQMLLYLESNKDKSELAQRMAYSLEFDASWTTFEVPEYLQKSVRWVVDGNE